MLRLTIAAAAAVIAAAVYPPHDAKGASVQSVTVEGTAFRIALTDGSVLPQTDLIGVVLTMGDGSGPQRHIRIDGVEPDPKDPAGEVMLYTLSEQDQPNSEWHNICLPDPEGRRMGFPLAGAFTADGQHIDAPGRFLITCTGGAEGKCVRFGYKPWRRTADGVALAPYYQTCVRLVRADYCGDGVGHTQNGMPIDIFDHIGIQRDEIAPGMSFEAAFGPDGATCVAHPRLSKSDTLERVTAMCPRLTGHTGVSCDETSPGLLFVRSNQ